MNNYIMRCGCIFTLCLCCITQAAPRAEIKARASAFIPTGSLFRHIYGKAGANFDIELATELCSCLYGWLNFDWFSKKGHSIGFHSPTKINMEQISFGIKIPCEIQDWLTLYAGIGPNFGHVRLNNHLCRGCNEHISKWAAGVVIKFSADLYVCEHFFVDLFADYLYQKVSFQQHANVSGVRAGAGLGVRF